MEFLIGLLVLGLIVGLFTRKKGDNTMDTLSAGCSTLIWIFFILFCTALFYYLFWA